MTRRFLLLGFLLGLSSKLVAAAQQLADGFRSGGERAPGNTDDANSRSSALSSAETENLVAFGEVLVGSRSLSPDERRDLAEHLEETARRSPDQVRYYRDAARLLDRLAGRGFAGLTITERAELVGRYRLDVRLASPGADPLSSRSEARMIRARVVPDLIRGYWASPAGWAAVGYTAFPGRCGDLDRYTRPER